MSQWYQTGYVQTSFVLIPSDLIGAVTASGFTSAMTEVIIDVAGYFAAAPSAVTSITAGTGLTGGTITSTGTIAVATAYQLPQTCANGQVPQSNGAGSWSCVTPSAGSGTVTSVATGSGLSGGPITTTGTISLAATNLLPTVACATNQIAKWSGSAWACAPDANSGGTVTSVSASAPLASSGGNAPIISLTGTIPVANGGTGQASLAANGIVYGQGTAAVGTAVGVAGDVLTGTAGAPAWTGSPSISGNLTLVNPSTAVAGNILKGGIPFIHNFGFANTFLGENAGNFTMTGSSNTASGVNALVSNTTGNNNTGSGFEALVSNTAGNNNTTSGAFALFFNTTGNDNTASGVSALQSNTTGISNTASGSEALKANTLGSFNSASGARALLSNTFGIQNTASGYQTLQTNTTGFNNTASGAAALKSNTTGGRNTASGVGALQNNTTGSSNIAMGEGAGNNLTTGNFNIHIGNQGAAAEGNTIHIGDGNQTSAFISGIRGVTTLGSAVAVLVDVFGQLGTISSSRRYKDDIADMDAASSALMKLRPVTFHYKTDQNASGRTLQYGLVAEEVAEVYPGLVAHSADGKIETVMYQFLPPMLLNEYQKQQRRIEAQTRKIAELETQTRRVDQLERDRRTQTEEIAKQRQVIAELQRDQQALRNAMAEMGTMMDQLRRTNSITASLPGR